MTDLIKIGTLQFFICHLHQLFSIIAVGFDRILHPIRNDKAGKPAVHADVLVILQEKSDIPAVTERKCLFQQSFGICFLHLSVFLLIHADCNCPVSVSLLHIIGKQFLIAIPVKIPDHKIQIPRCLKRTVIQGTSLPRSILCLCIGKRYTVQITAIQMQGIFCQSIFCVYSSFCLIHLLFPGCICILLCICHIRFFVCRITCTGLSLFSIFSGSICIYFFTAVLSIQTALTFSAAADCDQQHKHQKTYSFLHSFPLIFSLLLFFFLILFLLFRSV